MATSCEREVASGRKGPEGAVLAGSNSLVRGRHCREPRYRSAAPETEYQREKAYSSELPVLCSRTKPTQVVSSFFPSFVDTAKAPADSADEWAPEHVKCLI